jgi:hypothetical protein
VKKEIIIEVKNGAIDGSQVKQIIYLITKRIYGPEIAGDLYDKNEFGDLDCATFYVNNRSKITIVLKKMLVNILKGKITGDNGTAENLQLNLLNCKKDFEGKFAAYAKDVSDLYYPKYDLRAYFGEKKFLGEGVFESGTTCFCKGGLNEMSKIFLTKFKRAKVLVLKRDDTEDMKGGMARAIVYFAGNRNIEMTNFYSNGLDIPVALWVEALRRLVGIEKVTWKKSSSNLPIYTNGDVILITTNKTRPVDLSSQKWPCPHCYEEINQGNFKMDKKDSTIYLGCPDCYNEEMEEEMECGHCGERCNGNEVYYNDAIEMFLCENCRGDLFYCNNCEKEGFSERDFIFSKKRGCYYCIDCAGTCNNCGMVVLRESDGLVEVSGGQMLCDDCRHYCNKCEEYYNTNDMVYDSIDEEYFCPDCTKEIEEGREEETRREEEEEEIKEEGANNEYSIISA